MSEKKSDKVISSIILSIIVFLMAVPLYFLINNAFKQRSFIVKSPLVLTSESFTFGNITKAFSLMKFSQSALVSIAILVISCAGLIILGSLASFEISTNKTKGMRTLYAIIAALITVPVSCAQIPLARELSSMGLLNNWFAPSIVYIAFGLPFTIFIFTGYSYSIPAAIWEAAKIDGCSQMNAYMHVYLPLIKMTTASIIIMRGTYIWNDILVPLITITSGKDQTLPQKLVSFASNSMSRWDLIFAATLLISLPMLVFYLFFQKSFVSALTGGAVKG